MGMEFMEGRKELGCEGKGHGESSECHRIAEQEAVREILERKETLSGHRTLHKHLSIDGNRKRLRLLKSLLKTDRGDMHQK